MNKPYAYEQRIFDANDGDAVSERNGNFDQATNRDAGISSIASDRRAAQPCAKTPRHRISGNAEARLFERGRDSMD